MVTLQQHENLEQLITTKSGLDHNLQGFKHGHG
jgi:hypothetical protein